MLMIKSLSKHGAQKFNDVTTISVDIWVDVNQVSPRVMDITCFFGENCFYRGKNCENAQVRFSQ